jgi:pyrimidine operon attenuation protein / uracil phosphoribosyltransferase
MTAETQIMNEADIETALNHLADAIIADFPKADNLIILGIRTRGALLADRLQTILSMRSGKEIPKGILDITLYRDDLSALGSQPVVRESEINYDLTDANIVVVDDVLFTGRTIRAAIDEIIDYGRPNLIRLAVLVDRGCHEYPIRADYIGKSIETTYDQHIRVNLKESDESEKVELLNRDPVS